MDTCSGLKKEQNVFPDATLSAEHLSRGIQLTNMMETFQCLRLISICGIEFMNKKDLNTHYEETHQEKEVDEAKANYVRKLVPDELIKRIVPDKEFLTQNTKDLEDMLKALPKETFYTEDVEFQKDFEDILNERVDDCNTKK